MFEDAADEPAGLGAIAPGPELAAALAAVEPADDAALIEVMAATERLKAWADGVQFAAVAALALNRPPVGMHDRAFAPFEISEYAEDEVACALHLSRGVARVRMQTGLGLLRLPEARVAMAGGVLDAAKARVLAHAVWDLSEVKATKVAARVLPRAPRQTLAQFRSAVERAVAAIDAQGAAARYEEATRSRFVAVQPLYDGMSMLRACQMVCVRRGSC